MSRAWKTKDLLNLRIKLGDKYFEWNGYEVDWCKKLSNTTNVYGDSKDIVYDNPYCVIMYIRFSSGMTLIDQFNSFFEDAMPYKVYFKENPNVDIKTDDKIIIKQEDIETLQIEDNEFIVIAQEREDLTQGFYGKKSYRLAPYRRT